jgi:hypothetical protein
VRYAVNRVTRWLIALGAAMLLAFGLGCLNYTKARGLEHHKQFAQEHGLPPPTESILFGGVAAVIVGSGLLGYLAGRKAKTRSAPP